MSLPDVSRLSSVPAEAWRALGLRLGAIGLSSEAIRGLVARVPGVIDPMRQPIRLWHARRQMDPVGYAVRMLGLGDPVTEEEARAVLGEVPLAPLVAAGFLTKGSDGYVSPFSLTMMGTQILFHDDLHHGGAAVMGLSDTSTALCLAARPTKPVKRILDLGCGSGAAAIFLAPDAERVIATDVNPRAITLARINTQLNGIDNVELREGDLFAPVAGEAFDLVVSQPPFVPRPASAAERVYQHGGPRGDELALRLLKELPRYLRAGGRAVILAEWPILQGEDIALEQRVRAAVPDSGIDVLLVELPPAGVDELSVLYAATTEGALGPAFVKSVLERREHLEALKVHEFRLTFNVLQRVTGRAGFTSTVTTRTTAVGAVSPARLERLAAGRDLLARGNAAVLAGKLRITPGIVFTRRGDSTAGAQAGVMATLAADSLQDPVSLNPGSFQLATLVDKAASANEAIQQIVAATGTPLQEVSGNALAALKGMILAGLLEPAPPA